MKIEKIELYNFGSYEGVCTFDLSSDDPDKRIIIVGGKNGAGKTTLFTSVQLCLYGNYAFGYKSAGRFYLKEVYNLINNKARIRQHETAYVKIMFGHTGTRDRSEYEITRTWSWASGSIEEAVRVTQNNIEMEEEELQNFQNYLIHLIPPDMLKLYFFDGEKIADYFLSDNKINIREALMILSGNDTFDILHDNVRRVLNNNKNKDTTFANQYILARQNASLAEEKCLALKGVREQLVDDLANAEAEIEHLKTNYASKGGLTLEQWNSLQTDLKTEEEKRERINWQRKSIATDILPFVILRDWINKILPQLERESEYDSYLVLKNKLSGNSFESVFSQALQGVGVKSENDIKKVLEKITGELLSEDWSGFTPYLQLSNDDKIQVHSVLNRVFEYNSNSLKDYQNRIEKSLTRSKEIRTKIQSSDIEHVEEYIRETTKLEGEIKLLSSKIEQIDTELVQEEDRLAEKQQAVSAARKSFESALKKESVSALSGRVLLLLEDLQRNIYSILLKKVEADLKVKLGQLMRKNGFFDDIKIDSDFNVHVIRNQVVVVEDLIKVVRNGGQSALRRSIGDVAVDLILDGAENVTNSFLIQLLKDLSDGEVVLPLEIDKDRMSSGEKQIFVMSLYWALMQQSENELPFIIDTPFARIDTEHRANITEHFFLDLMGQLFILSTNEELSDEHLEAMNDQIAHVYMLEYGADKKTTIYQNMYFEV